jgi:hypothetical protein
MSASSAEAASAAVERLRTAREQAQRRRDAARTAVEQLRQRNREESRQLAERSHLARRGHQPLPDSRQPRELHLYNTDHLDAPAAHPPARPAPQQHHHEQRPSDGDWSQESWLH